MTTVIYCRTSCSIRKKRLYLYKLSLIRHVGYLQPNASLTDTCSIILNKWIHFPTILEAERTAFWRCDVDSPPQMCSENRSHTGILLHGAPKPQWGGEYFWKNVGVKWARGSKLPMFHIKTKFLKVTGPFPDYSLLCLPQSHKFPPAGNVINCLQSCLCDR